MCKTWFIDCISIFESILKCLALTANKGQSIRHIAAANSPFRFAFSHPPKCWQLLRPKHRTNFTGNFCACFSFIRPSSDGTYYGMVMSVRPSLRPSVTIFRTFLLHALTCWAEICVSLYFNAHKIKFECHQFPSIFARVIALLNFKL